MTDAVGQPPTPPTVVTYRFQRDGKQWTEERYDARDLWLREQHAGAWSDEFGNRLIVATVMTPYIPPGEGPEHVRREDYEQALQSHRRSPEQWTKAELTQWLQEFLESQNIGLESVRPRTTRLRDLVQVRVSEPHSNVIAYLFRLNRTASGQRMAPQDWFLAAFLLSKQTESTRALREVEQKFLQSITTCVRSTASLTKQARIDPSTPSDGRSSEYVASRRHVVQSIHNLEGWWHEETDHYILLSNLSSRHRITVHKLKTNVEILYSAYAQLVPARVEIDSVNAIRVFATPEEYAAYVGPAYAWTGGLWVPGKKELVIRPIDWGGTSDQRERILSSVYHEGFHQYVFYALDKIQPSAWFNEGHAGLFENADVGTSRFILREDEKKAELLEEMIGTGHLPILEMLHMSYVDFYSFNEKKRMQNYALSWAMIYYLRKGVGRDAKSPYAPLLDSYVDALLRTRDSEKATSVAFEGIDIAAFGHDIEAFWTSRSRRSAARKSLFK